MKNNRIEKNVMDSLLSTLQNPQQSHGDFSAQISANKRGLMRLTELIESLGVAKYNRSLTDLNNYAARIAENATSSIGDGVYQFADVMDDDGQGNTDIPVQATITVNASNIHVDFTGTARQVKGNINCPLSVAAAAVYYVFRCLMPDNTPACAGSFRHITLSAPEGCLLNAKRPAAVAAGNVETSTRIVDVIIGALVKAIPEKLPAASHGSMNNLAMGAAAGNNNKAWDYYETIGGGMGANYLYNGLSGVQTHMTNTLNTPVEVLELNYPLRVNEYSLRKNSAGQGEHNGGEGLVRSITLLQQAHITLLTERRSHLPWGINAGDAKAGQNLINGELCPAKFSRVLEAGDCLTIKTPGGGGYSRP
jgi:N-methylhydantoinase B